MRTVLIAGGSGKFGFKIARALSYRSDAKVRVLVQSGSISDADIENLRWLSDRDIAIFEGDLNDASSLNPAVEGVDAVISAVKGGARTMVDGQKNLLDVSLANQVSRFIPSDYTLDYSRLEPADHAELALKAEFANILKRESIEHTFIFNGTFMEDLFSPSTGIFDFGSQSVHYWGDGETRLDVTQSEDAAEYVAEAVFDPGAANTRLNLVGDIVTLNEIISRFDEVTEYRLNRRCKGTTDTLKAVISDKERKAELDTEYTALQYQWALFSGAARLGDTDNERYRNVYPTIMLDYIALEL